MTVYCTRHPIKSNQIQSKLRKNNHPASTSPANAGTSITDDNNNNTPIIPILIHTIQIHNLIDSNPPTLPRKKKIKTKQNQKIKNAPPIRPLPPPLHPPPQTPPNLHLPSNPHLQHPSHRANHFRPEMVRNRSRTVSSNAMGGKNCDAEARCVGW